MSTGDPKPSPPPATPAPPQGSANQRPPVVVVPVPQDRDPDDPIDPQRIAREELTVRQVLQEADRLIAVVRPAAYGEYRGLTGQVEAYFRAFRNDSAWAEFEYNRAVRYMNDLATLKLGGIEGLNAGDAARKAVGDSWRQWWGIYNTFKSLAARYAVLAHIKDDLVAGVARPPSGPPEQA